MDPWSVLEGLSTGVLISSSRTVLGNRVGDSEDETDEPAGCDSDQVLLEDLEQQIKLDETHRELTQNFFSDEKKFSFLEGVRWKWHFPFFQKYNEDNQH